jgi:hypothetical protein
MEGDTIEEETKWQRENRPDEWLNNQSKILDQAIRDYNECAERHGFDVIVAFKMTKEEREELYDGTEDERERRDIATGPTEEVDAESEDNKE